MPYVKNPGNGYFQIREADASNLSVMINSAKADGINTEEYNGLSDYLNRIMPRPATGYYLMKSYYNKYKDNETGVLESTKSTSDITNIVRLERQGATNKYKIAIQGSYLGTPTQSADVPLVSEGAEFEAVTTTGSIGKVAFKAGEGTYGSVHTSENQDYRVVGWTVDAAASIWTIEDAPAAVSIALNTVAPESYATFYAPFGVTLDGGADLDAYIVTIENGRAKATSIGKQIPAATPVLLRSSSGVTSVTATINDEATATTGGNKLEGTYTQLTSLPEGNNYILGNGDDGIGFYKLASGKVIGANKAYLNAGGALVKGLTLDFGGEDAVKSINAESVDNSIYDLSGRRVKSPSTGLYIVNGKKVVIK